MSATHVAVHTISFRGKAGIIFSLLAGSLTLYVVGFATVGWATRKSDQSREGLWENCTCHQVKNKDGGDVGLMQAVQAMMCLGLVGLFLALLLITIYLCIHTVSKNSTIIALVGVCFISFVFMLIGFIVYGVEKSGSEYALSWSFAVTVLASVLCFVAGIISVVQMRKSGVRM